MTGNYMQWIVLLLVVGASFVSWLIRKLQEEQERRQRREEAARRELERLRTGREPGANAETTAQMQRAQELQARRQQQLQELRRRQQERARPQQPSIHIEQARVGPAAPPTATSRGTGAGTPPTVVWAPGSSGTTVPTQRGPVPMRRTPAQQPTRPRPQPMRTQSARPQPARPQPAQRVQTRPERRTMFPQPAGAPPRPAAPEAPSGPRPVAAPREAYALRSPDAALLASIRPGSSDEWRRAIIMHEILSPPVGQRDQPL